ncbi:hypothetical protein [Psychromonas aquimarina]|uniref:hypothetical protein n=1 Tax=Psychromonas aquimarina TaxID=444919 RepID=UPI00040AF231|nr:hypothetical protein [Psychromonas aquimarina]
MKKLISTFFVSTLLLLTSVTVSAIPMPEIEGSINFTGDSVNTVVGTAVTKIDFSGLPIVNLATGDFVGSEAMSVTFVDPFTVGPVSALWVVNGFTFDLKSITYNVANAFSITVAGDGTIKHAGYADTAGEWVFTSQTSTSEVSFSATAVPAPAAAAVLGLALIGFGFVRRGKK